MQQPARRGVVESAAIDGAEDIGGRRVHGLLTVHLEACH
jgi:hypothetical protein